MTTIEAPNAERIVVGLIQDLEVGGEPEFHIAVNVEPITLSWMAGTVPDPEWVWEDDRGHEHRAERSGEGSVTYPTLVWVVTKSWWCEDCRDMHDEGEYRCKLCKQTVKPRTKYRPAGSKTVPGRRTIELTVPRWRAKEALVAGDDVTVYLDDAQGERLQMAMIAWQERAEDALPRPEWFDDVDLGGLEGIVAATKTSSDLHRQAKAELRRRDP